MNKVILTGRLTKTPEAKQTHNGVSVTTFSLAVTRRMNRDEADFINVVAWRGLADNCAKYLDKGRQVCVVGELRTRSYDAADGGKRYITEVVADDVEFLSSGQKQQVQESSTIGNKAAQSGSDGFTDAFEEAGFDDEDFPF